MRAGDIDLEAMLEAAIAAREGRDLDQAERLCRDILQVDPDHPEALNLLGVVLQDIGQATASIPLLSRACELDPGFSDAFANLARAFRLSGDDEKAVAPAREATELDPSLGEAWLQLGFAQLTLQRPGEAIAALRRAAVRTPDVADLHAGIGVAAKMLNDHEAAASAWREVLRLLSNRIDALVHLGTALNELNQPDEALALHRRAVERSPNDKAALGALAHTLHSRSDAEELVSVCRRLLAIDPGRLDILLFLATGLMWMGDFDAAKSTCETVQAVDPDNVWFKQQLGVLFPELIDQEKEPNFRVQLNDATLPLSERVTAGFALGRTLDLASRYDEAFDAYAAANALLHAANAAANEGFDPAELQTYNTFARTVFSPSVFSKLRPHGNPSELPVFVVGMPRSGTTLVEQIVASHPRVFGAGEPKDVMRHLVRVNGGRNFVSPTEWSPTEIRREANDLVDTMRAIGRRC